MIFLPISITLFILFVLLLPFLIFLLHLQIIQIAFYRLGMNPTMGIAFFLFSLLGSSINIPIIKRNVPIVIKSELSIIPALFRPRIPTVEKQILAINLGGAIIPLLLCLYLFTKILIIETIISTTVIIIVAKLLSRPIRGIGIVLPAFIPPIISAMLALMLTPDNPAPTAYISGVLGTLIGADILNLPALLKMREPGIISIGGAGIFDGIYLVGIIAILLA